METQIPLETLKFCGIQFSIYLQCSGKQFSINSMGNFVENVLWNLVFKK